MECLVRLAGALYFVLLSRPSFVPCLFEKVLRIQAFSRKHLFSKSVVHSSLEKWVKSVIYFFSLSTLQMFFSLAIHPQQPLQDWNIQYELVGLPTRLNAR